MKTTLIQISPNDDLISVKEKMQWNPSGRILLVVPRINHAIQSPLDLRRIVREGRKLGAQVAISTSQKALHRLAEEQGIIVFSSVIAAQKNEWKEELELSKSKQRSTKNNLVEKGKPFKTRIAKENNTWRRIVFFFIGVIAPIFLILVLLPQATVKVFPKTLTRNVNLDLIVKNTGVGSPDPGVIPATLQTITLEVEDSIPTTGKTTIAVEFAKGILRVTNLSDRPVTIPAKLRISTSPPTQVVFQTLQGTLLEGGINQFVDVPIEAIEPGMKGNTIENSILTVEGELSQLIRVNNPTPTRGGADIEVNAVAASDVETLKARLDSKLKSLYPAQGSNNEAIYIIDSIQILTRLDTFSSEVGDPADQINLKIKEEISVLAIKSVEIIKFIKSMAMSAIPDGYESVSGSLQFSLPTRWNFDETAQAAKSSVKLTQIIRKIFDADSIKAQIAGKSVKKAISYIDSSIQSDESPRISIKPAIWAWLPVIPSQIEVKIP
jgi:Baseplate J-like protein